jgi:hypothetical protein
MKEESNNYLFPQTNRVVYKKSENYKQSENLSAVITSQELSQVMHHIQEPESSPNPTALDRITQSLMSVKTMKT